MWTANIRFTLMKQSVYQNSFTTVLLKSSFFKMYFGDVIFSQIL